ncbi:ROK family protein [Rubrolithibacter danxiaensis]|uniref:ROK family protein n=1 Tax=Rubrolithibacter danxiaensis TaxID=3390805 RepID=UPI003BF80249
MNSSIVSGVDIGGSHITAALVDLESRNVLTDSYCRSSIDPAGSVDEIINDWCSVIELSFPQEITDRKVAIGMPGPFDYENGISYIKDNHKYESLYGLNVKRLMAERLSISPDNIILVNDAACFLQGEAFCGAARGYNQAIGVTLGTGLGTSKFIDGITTDGNLWCMPFKDSIAEDYISTRWFLKRFHELTGQKIGDVKELIKLYGSYSFLKDIFHEFSCNLAQFLISFIEMAKPEVIVLGGNISNAHESFLPEVEKILKENFHAIPVELSKLKEEAAILGAASYWHNAIIPE